jgi:type I restriction enzyme S subunit
MTTESTRATIGELCELVNGRAFKPTEWATSGLPIIRIQNLNDDTKEFNYFEGDYSKKHEVNDGDLLFSWSGTPGTSFGAFFWNRGRGVLNQHIFNVLIDKKRVEKRYFRYAINSRLNEIISHAHGGVGLQHITKGKLESVEIPLPPLSEQKRIADILDKADAIRRKRQEALLLPDTLTTSAFLEFFGDPATNPNGWDKQQLSEVADILGGFAFKSSWFQEQGTKVVRIGDISDGFVSTTKAVAIDADEHSVSDTYRARSGDILMALSGATTGKTGIVLPEDDGVYVNQRIAIIRARTPELQSFIRVLLLDQRLLRRLLGTAGGSAQENLSPRALASTEIPIPSTQTLERFHAVRHCLTRLRTDELKRGVSESEQLFNSLVQRAFKGEL